MVKFRLVVFEKGREIHDLLMSSDFVITSCTDFKSKKCNAVKLSSDAIIIDMSCFDKTEVFEYIYKNSLISTYIVNADEELKYQFYEYGAVDVMTGLLDKVELKYKINIAINKNKYKAKRYFLGDLVYEIETGALIKDEDSIVLPTLQNKIFTMLLDAYYENRIVRKEEIFNSIIDESSRIHNHIARLRCSLACIKSSQVVIDTVYGKGYKLLVVDKD